MILMPAVAIAAALAGCSGGSSPAVDDAGSACSPVTPPATCPSPPPSYSGEIGFIVATFCGKAECHGSSAGVSVHNFTSYDGIVADRLTFAREAALCPSSSMGMPPAGSDQPSEQQRIALVTWAGICKAPNN
jgi:hypothetical protein